MLAFVPTAFDLLLSLTLAQILTLLLLLALLHALKHALILRPRGVYCPNVPFVSTRVQKLLGAEAPQSEAAWALIAENRLDFVEQLTAELTSSDYWPDGPLFAWVEAAWIKRSIRKLFQDDNLTQLRAAVPLLDKKKETKLIMFSSRWLTLWALDRIVEQLISNRALLNVVVRPKLKANFGMEKCVECGAGRIRYGDVKGEPADFMWWRTPWGEWICSTCKRESFEDHAQGGDYLDLGAGSFKNNVLLATARYSALFGVSHFCPTLVSTFMHEWLEMPIQEVRRPSL